MGDRIPNLFLVGAMRSGTTALHEVLDRHPDIFMSRFKEPAYFTDPDQLAADSRVVSAAGYAGDRAAYLSLFADGVGHRYRGESSTHYTKAPRITGVAERIAAASPEARILYFVRNPVLRVVSHYRFAVRRKEERRSLVDAVQAEPFYCAVSDYALQLRPYIDTFGRGRIWVGTLEAMTRDPVAELHGLHRWLGLEPGRGDAARFPRLNAIDGTVAAARGPNVLHRIGSTDGYQRVARTLVPPRVRAALRRVLTRPVGGDELGEPTAVDHLREVLAPRIAAFEELMERRFPEWAEEDR